MSLNEKKFVLLKGIIPQVLKITLLELGEI